MRMRDNVRTKITYSYSADNVNVVFSLRLKYGESRKSYRLTGLYMKQIFKRTQALDKP